MSLEFNSDIYMCRRPTFMTVFPTATINVQARGPQYWLREYRNRWRMAQIQNQDNPSLSSPRLFSSRQLGYVDEHTSW